MDLRGGGGGGRGIAPPLSPIFHFHAAFGKKIVQTRMHSSRMRTARLLTIYQHALLGGGVSAQGGVPAQGGYLPGGTCLGGVPFRGVYLPGSVPAQGGTCPEWGCTCPGGYLPWYSPCEQNVRQVQKYYLAPNFVCGR